MRRRVMLVTWLAAALSAGCTKSNSALPLGGDGGTSFDPCAANPSQGFDPVAAGLPGGCCESSKAAHCVPASAVPSKLVTGLATCKAQGGGDGLCLPDVAIEHGASWKPADCTSSIGSAAGVCLSLCIPLIANNPQSALLGQDGCMDNELCVPCVNPLDGTSTGACTIITGMCTPDDAGLADAGPGMCPYTGPPLLDVTTLGDCNPLCGGAHCVPAVLVPTAQQSLLSKCTTTDSKAGFCTPDKLIETGGNYVPPSCKSIGGVEGRCTSVCLPAVAEQAALLPDDTCSAGNKCVPCYNPTASDPSAPTGACNLACDKPKNPPGAIMCPYVGPPLLDPTTLSGCDPACAGAHCIPESLVPAGERALLASCPGGFCAPDILIATGGNFVPKPCKSVAGAEGRCLSICLGPIAEQAAILPRDVCGADERCAPCYNPLDPVPTAPTGACSISSCDKPAKPPLILSCPWTGDDVLDPTTLPACDPACGGAHCLPAADVPADEQKLLEACPGGFCTPDTLIRSGGKTVARACKSIAGVEGRCTSTCLPDIAAQASLLPKDTCFDFEVCAPCYNPVGADPKAPTGACTIGCDAPTDPPTIIMCPWNGSPLVDPMNFPACSPACDNAHCLPGSLVPAAQQALLATCPGGFCTPDVIIKTGGNYIPTTCASVAGKEGRCLSACLPSIGAQSSVLPRDICGSDELCAPCYNPLGNASIPTGACSVSTCDMPAHPATPLACPYPSSAPDVIDPTTFPDCFSATCASAHCLPASQVPLSQQSLLKKCADNVSFCTPDSIIRSGGNAVPKLCNSIAGAEGRCLSTCLPAVAAQANILPKVGCGSGERCVPCYDPTAANPDAPTGACSTAPCDHPDPLRPPVHLTCPWNVPPKAPVIDPATLPICDNGGCPGAHCLPGALVPPALAAQLSVCATGRCAPDHNIETAGNYKPVTCPPFTGTTATGRCQSKCLPGVAAQASQLLQTSACASTELCTPCNDPFTGAATGACSSAPCDAPPQTPYKFPRCCFYNDTGYQATCVPTYLVPSGQQGQLNRDVCASTALCVPQEFTPVGPFGEGCSSWLISVGTCVSDCVDLGIGSILPRGSCPAHHTCIPCGSAPGGSPGC